MLRHVANMPFFGIGAPVLAMRNIWRGNTARSRGLGARALRIQAPVALTDLALPRRARGRFLRPRGLPTVLGGGRHG
jgi:hypothetical protein